MNHVHDGSGDAGLQVVLQAAPGVGGPAQGVGWVVEEDEGNLQTLRVGANGVQRGATGVAQHNNGPGRQQGAHCACRVQSV